jgi:hypothetical protein
MKISDIISYLPTIAKIVSIFTPPGVSNIINLIDKYGLPALQKAVEGWERDDITIEELEALVKPPEEYFK